MVNLALPWAGRSAARRGLWRAALPLALALGLAGLAGPARGGAAGIALAIFLAVALAARSGLDQFHPPGRFGRANTVTLARAAGAALLAGLALTGPPPAQGWGLAAAAAPLLALDGLDGWLARRDGLASAFGARFDMEVDTLLGLALALLAWQLGKAGPWVLGLGLMRPGFVVLGWLVPAFAAPLAPSLRRKAVCAITLGALVLLLAPVVTPPASRLLAAAALALLGWSFACDLRALLRR